VHTRLPNVQWDGQRTVVCTDERVYIYMHLKQNGSSVYQKLNKELYVSVPVYSVAFTRV